MAEKNYWHIRRDGSVFSTKERLYRDVNIMLDEENDLSILFFNLPTQKVAEETRNAYWRCLTVQEYEGMES